ncbi:proton-conducting transporter membrane subunit [Mycobacterium sp. 94-17]|uniref:proton-conducting transporter transmembrane domain-containing protein n=1 Tax=Mycobacterium sp. 94-17 TaxID=2986147 RepID=UPI002D1EA3EE|nr:proton-conducting transporter membrane subunit [Mycobacterium sp. 94-17]MEB4211203.1 proton-conducting transporter membrane subunit [Mycobacterium sp. 94-17]
MTEWAVFGTAAMLWAGAAITAVISNTGARRISPTLGGVGGLAAFVGGVSLLFLHSGTVSKTLSGNDVVGPVTLRLTPLAGVFVVVLGVVAMAIACYTPRYHASGRGTSLYLATYHLALLATLTVLIAGTVVVFLVAWESMALLSYLMILRHQRRDDVAAGAFWFLALSEIGFGLIVAAFVLLSARAGSTDLAVIAKSSAHLSPGTRDAVFMLALIGFGFKAGLVPLHVWLPEAHPVAPADGSGFLSGMVVKLGIYGILLFSTTLLKDGPAWWGLATMGMGALTAVVGILYALTERDIKKFLAYSTIENIGIIAIAVGAGMTFTSYGQAALGAFLLLAALYHVGNHGIYKTLLFLEAGVIEHATGTRNMDRLGGLIHRLPRTAVISMIGTLAITTLPPLNGFVSEWLIFQGLFQGFRIPSHLVGILIVVAAACLGLTGGLAVCAFVRAYGIPFLGMPRTKAAAEATESGQPVFGAALLASGCLALGVGAPLVITALGSAVRSVTSVDVLPRILIDKLTIIPANTDFSAFSPTYLAACLFGALIVPIAVHMVGRPKTPGRRTPVWDGGIVTFKPRMQYSAMTFAAPVRVTFDRLYQPSVTVQRASDEPAGRSGPVHYEAEVTPLFQRYLYRPTVVAVQYCARLVTPIQSGDVNVYLLYVFLAVLIAYLLGALGTR